MQGYDLDDTLAEVEFDLASVRGLANVFRGAKVKYVPDAEFVVITARPHDTEALKRATRDWLRENQPNWSGRIIWASGSEDEIIKKKAQAINSLGLTDFTDNNKDILEKLSPLTTAPLWEISDGQRERFNQ
jgi:hypothetical protein